LQYISFSIVYDPGGSTGKSSSRLYVLLQTYPILQTLHIADAYSIQTLFSSAMKERKRYASSSETSQDSDSSFSLEMKAMPRIQRKYSSSSSSETDSSSSSDHPPSPPPAKKKKPFEPKAKKEKINPNEKVSNSDEPHVGNKPTPTMPEPLLPLVDSSLISATTPADVKEYQNSYVFEMDMPGMKSDDIKVEVEEDVNVVVITGERKREEGGGVKYLNMEQRRRFGKFTGRFLLPQDANAEAVSAACQDGVLTVTALKKLLPPQNPNKPRKAIEVVKIA
jgi:HSP20 family protein